MAYLRPRRGTKDFTESLGMILKRGEVFFEVPDTGIGTGYGRIKMGDGLTEYADLPYFMYHVSTIDFTLESVAFTDSNDETEYSNNINYLYNISPSATIRTLFTNIKQLLVNFNEEIGRLISSVNNMETSKQDKLTAGKNITISNENVISTYIAPGSMFVVVADFAGETINIVKNNIVVGTGVADDNRQCIIYCDEIGTMQVIKEDGSYKTVNVTYYTRIELDF